MEDTFLKYTKVPPTADMVVPAVELKEKVEALKKKLQENVVRLQNSAEFRNFLIAMSRFHNYSWNNQMLIWLQKPGATHVAGYRTWEDLERHVKFGEKGIAILAPLGPVAATSWIRVTDNAIYAIKRGEKGWDIYDNNENLIEEGFRTYTEAARKLKEMGFVEHKEVLSVHNFKVVYVFDISQTAGKPLPEFQVPELTGEYNPVLFEELLHVCKGQHITVSFEPEPTRSPTTKGYYLPPNKIWIKPDEAEAQKLNVLTHETCHHYTKTVFQLPPADAETIAESAAYVVGAHYGFDTGTRSFPYVAGWAQDEKRLHANMNSIQEVAEKVIEAIEAHKIRLPMTREKRFVQVGQRVKYIGHLIGMEHGIAGTVITYHPASIKGPQFPYATVRWDNDRKTLIDHDKEGKDWEKIITVPMKANPQTIRQWEDTYTRDELVKMAKEKGLDIGGSKRELIERILRGQLRMRI